MGIGNTILIIALILSLVSMVFLARSASGDKFSLYTSRRIYYLSSLLIFFASLLLLSGFLFDQFQYTYIFNHSEKSMGLAYKIAAFWAGDEGSLLLWLFILNICGIFICRKQDEYENIVMSLLTILQVFFLILLIVKSPFSAVWESYPGEIHAGQIPPDGTGLNPLLMDPWMVTHPPVLFLGYAAATIPFGYAIAALLKQDYDKWIKLSYKWITFSSLTLGIGIFMGGYWAYKVLGWGGYWGWDPVENSSLIPWLASVMLIHGLILQKRKSLLKRSNLLMALVYFILVLYSTFLTRSGVLSDFSVHSFGESNTSIFLISYIIFFLIISVFLFSKRFSDIKSEKLTDKFFTMESITVFGIIILGIYNLIIFTGTSFPIISGIFLNNPTAVTENFYNNLSVPFGILILLFIILVSFAIHRYSKGTAIIAAVLALVTGVAFNLMFTKSPAAYIFTIMSLFLTYLIIRDMYKSRKVLTLAPLMAHLGIALLVLGIIASNFHSWTLQKKIEKGATAEAGPVSVTLEGFEFTEPTAVAINVKRGNKEYHGHMPYFMNKKTQSLFREPYILKGASGDIYITPQQYVFAEAHFSSAIISKGEEQTISGLKVKFIDFDTSKMGSEEMTIFANILVNGKKYKPGMKHVMGQHLPIESKIAGTNRIITLEGIDAGNKKIKVHITPEKGAVLPPDYAVLDITMKRLIWLVWLGTLLITGGFAIAMIREGKEKIKG